IPDQGGDELLYFNGINGESGEYDLPPMSAAELSAFIRGEAKPENLSELRFRHESKGLKHLGVKEGVDPKRLDASGWGIVFAHDADPAIQEALSPLLRLREAQAGGRFRIYAGAEGYRPDDSKSAWLARAPRKMGPGPADPDKVPYYLLVCGSPEQIPYRFQSQLDVQYAVGRIHFNTLDGYANYARSVVETETGSLKLPRRMRLFGVANPLDQATNLSAKQLVAPLKDQLAGQFADWSFETALAEEATKARLARLLGGDETPSLLLTASHGMDFPMTSPRQIPHQGALLCQDWPGPGAHRGPIPQDFYFAGDDLGSEANLLGLIAFFFACYGAGTPELDDFAKQAFKERARIAPRPFLAGLPTRMLGLPRGGALAVIGHVERAWTYSFRWQKAGTQTEVFRSTLHRLLDGHPVGSALEFFNERYSELSTVLADELEEIEFGKQSDPYELAGLWTANNDARGYALIGDPAVRLPVAQPGEAERGREALTLRAAATTSATSASTQGATAAASESAAFGATAVTQETAAGFSVTTYVAADPASQAGKTLVACTRVAANGDIETLVAEGFAHRDALLELHRGLVEQAVGTHRGA
ncbi:MAG: hypothetical protein ACM3ST_15965, partial [Bdellovibrio bacteriovorus]